MRKTHPDFIPLLEAAKGEMRTKYGDSALVFKLEEAEVFEASVTQLIARSQVFARIIGLLSPNTALVKQDWYHQSLWSAGVESRGDPAAPGGALMLEQASDRHFSGRMCMQHDAFLFILRMPARRGMSAGRALMNRHFVPQDTMSPQAISELRREAELCQRMLEEAGFGCRLLTTEEMVSSDSTVGLLEAYSQLNMTGEAQPLRDIDLRNGLKVGNQHCLMYSLSDAGQLPDRIQPYRMYKPVQGNEQPIYTSLMSKLGIELPVNHILTTYVFVDDQPAVRKRLERKARQLQSLASHSRGNQLQWGSTMDLLSESTDQQMPVVRACCTLLAYTDKVEDLPALRGQCAAAFTHNHFVPREETVSAAQLWCAGFPGNAGDLPPDETFYSTPAVAACLMTLEGGYREGANGLRLAERIHGAPVHVDLWDGPMREGLINNTNKVMFGGSGGGKSMSANLMIRHQYSQGAYITVVDDGHSYQGICQLLGGDYKSYDGTDSLRFNPFLILRDARAGPERLEALRTLIAVVWKGEDEKLSRIEHVALSDALNRYGVLLRTEAERVPGVDGFLDFLRDDYSARLRMDGVRASDFDVEGLCYVMRPFRRDGEYGYLLNAAAHEDDSEQRLVVIELGLIKHHPLLLTVVMILLMDRFIALVRRFPGVRKIFVMDEAWKPLMKLIVSAYIVQFYKTMRKYFGEPFLISQELGDLDNPVIKDTVLNNCDCKILLEIGRSEKELAKIQQHLGLSEKDMGLLQSLNRHKDPALSYKEMLVVMGNRHSQVYRVEVSTEEYLCYTTQPREKLLVKEYAQRHGGLQEGIVALAAAIRDGSVRLGLFFLVLLAVLFSPVKGRAQFPIAAIIDAAVKRVIVATDLSILRLQTDAIEAQDAQRTAENDMQSEELSGIGGWLQKIRALYADYYTELWQVKAALSNFSRVAGIIRNEGRLLFEYRQAWAYLSRDGHFSAGELARMDAVYQHFIGDCAADIRLLYNVITDGVTQMEDGGRLVLIDRIDDDVGSRRRALRQFTQDHILLSLQRSKDLRELTLIKQFYGIQ